MTEDYKKDYDTPEYKTASELAQACMMTISIGGLSNMMNGSETLLYLLGMIMVETCMLAQHNGNTKAATMEFVKGMVEPCWDDAIKLRAKRDAKIKEAEDKVIEEQLMEIPDDKIGRA